MKHSRLNKYIIIGILFIASIQVSAEGKWIAGMGNDFGYNKKVLKLWKYPANSTFSKGLNFNLGYELSLGKNFSASIRPGIQQHYDIIEINEIKISDFSYNFNIPFDIHYRFLPKWSTYMGFSIQDYRPIKDMALNKSDNVRLNLNLGLNYHFNDIWSVELAYSRIESDEVDSFLFKNYTNHFYVGICRNLQIPKRRKND